MNDPKYAILHHTADASGGDQIARVNEYHRIRFGMLSRLGYYVGYHYLIERTGEVIKTREHDEEGAHTRGKNTESIGICLAGNFDLERPTEAQMNALDKLLGSLAIRYSVSEYTLAHHSDYADTHCPGWYFTSREWRLHLLEEKTSFLKRILIWLQLAER